jgi:alkyl-hydroperoxide reductase/thiol specific antioxidant family protein
VANRFDELRARGVHVVAISMSRPETLTRYRASRPLPFPIFADPERKVYAALGLGRTSWARFLRPGVIWRYLKMVAAGAKVRRVPEGEDALQTGGDFLVAADGRVLWEYRSDDPTDRPTVEQLLAVRSVANKESSIPSSP